MITDDTIAALSTPLGEGGIGIVRMSGSDAIAIADKVFSSVSETRLSQVDTHTLHYGFIVGEDEGKIDEVLVTIMRAPLTYTREDVVEINCHGGIVATRAVLDLLLRQGARLADRGEFTQRAFANGRITLDQAKSVLDVVEAKTRVGLEAAIDQLDGRFSRQIVEIRGQIADLLAGVEVGINYPDVESDTEEIIGPLSQLSSGIDRLLAQSERGKIVRNGLRLVIIGRPNVGKSTLLNHFLAEDRAIVTPVPGTTRDTIEDQAIIGGVPFELVDTAGLGDPSGLVEREGVKKTEEAINRADLLLLVLDGSEPLTVEDQELIDKEWDSPLFLIVNKNDLPQRLRDMKKRKTQGIYSVSAKTGSGMDELSEGIVGLLLGGKLPSRSNILLLDTWERNLLRRVHDAVETTLSQAEDKAYPDMIAEELRIAHKIAGELQGIDLSEDVLDHLFARFCVGK